MTRNAAIILTILLAGSSAWAEGFNVREHVLIQSENVFFKDIVVEKLPNSVAGVFLTKSPAYGSTSRLNGSFIAARFRQAGGDQNLFHTPDLVSIERAFQVIPYSLIQQSVREWIVSQRSGQDTQISFHGNERDITGPPGAVKINVALKENYSPMGRQSIPVEISINNNLFKTVRVDSFTDVREELVATRHSITRGRVIAAEDLVLKSVSAKRIRGLAFRDQKDVIGKVARTAIASGELVRERHIETAPAVKRGDVVMLVLSNPFLYVKTYGVALEDAAIGEVVKVKNLDTKVRVLGRVQDAQTVRVEM
jgi:flagellar basal body P-ring formation protein FlgA